MYKNNKNDRSRFKKTEYIDISSGREDIQRKIAWGRIFFAIFFSLIGIAGCTLIYFYVTLNSFNYKEIGDPPVETQDDTVCDNMILNVLLLGTDSQSAGDSGRTDTILLLSVDARNKKLKITSLMRDMWVRIPGYSEDRLNAAYTHGGARVTINTIKYNFGIGIDRYVLVDFDNFEKIVDTIGGIEIDLTPFEVNYINKNSGDINLLKGSGTMHLTGRQALTHSRNRDSIGSDYDRTERQRNVMKAIFEKSRNLNIGQITKLISTIAPLITTNFKPGEITKLASRSLTYLSFPIYQFRLPTDSNVRNETIDSKMVLVINDMQKARRDLTQFIYEGKRKTSQN